MADSGGTVWDLVSLGLSAGATFLSSLVMFILNGFRGDIRDTRREVGDLREKLGGLEGQVKEFHDAHRKGRL